MGHPYTAQAWLLFVGASDFKHYILSQIVLIGHFQPVILPRREPSGVPPKVRKTSQLLPEASRAMESLQGSQSNICNSEL
jgi:hypothetical protein